jgi:hypothetical protein
VFTHYASDTLSVYIYVPTAIEKITECLKSMLNMVGSQNNKLYELETSLKSFDGGFQSLEADAYKLEKQNFFGFLGLLDTTECLEDLETDTEEGLCDIQDCVEQVKETLDDINACVHPCRGEGWEEVINVDYTIDGATCPDEWQVSTDARLTVRGCSRTDFTPGQSIDLFSVSVNEMEYDEVCGRINGYSFDTPSAFSTAGLTAIEDVYVNGISLTHGSGPDQEHIWTFAAAWLEKPEGDIFDLLGQCPCDGGPDPPSFVGQNYFCEAGVGEINLADTVGLHDTDLLWDGLQCTTEVCCTRAAPNNPPYFHSYLDEPTSDDINIRLMFNTFDADVLITNIELYVR